MGDFESMMGNIVGALIAVLWVIGIVSGFSEGWAEGLLAILIPPIGLYFGFTEVF